MSDGRILSIVKAYRHPIVRVYALGRFGILRQRFLSEIGQYLPESGRVLDIGCGFGLFAMYFAATRPGITVSGFDLNERRIQIATDTADRLGLTNVSFSARDARDFRGGEPCDAVYMLDIVHHIPVDAVHPLLEAIHGLLPAGGMLLLKDVDSDPFYKRWFTWVLDRAMDPKATVNYWPQHKLKALLESIGFTVYLHQMIDFLPYPHVLYVCQRTRT